jgi:spermidine/putrescine transport system substrate-binding protein
MVGYATPNKDALPLLDEKLRSNKTIFPDQADLERGEFHKDVGESTAIYEKYWQQLKTGR